MMPTLYRRLLPLSVLLALGVIVLGAWVRLSDAGLGCPDWPGCYGEWLGVPEHAADTGKAWKEMIHRYFAGSLGLLVMFLCLCAWRQRPRRLPGAHTFLAGLIVFQALLGMWTVTLLLKPLVVSAHLLGGMSILGLLGWLALAARERPPAAPAPRRLAGCFLFFLGLQIALGAWVSSNYAALACPDFPACQGRWLPEMDFEQAFSLHRPLGRAADGSWLGMPALTAIHWSHRLGALAVTGLGGWLGVALLRRPGWRGWGMILVGLLVLQLGLGIANVLLSLPLPLAVAHNAGAAVLLLATVALNVRLRTATASGPVALGQESPGNGQHHHDRHGYAEAGEAA